MENKNNSNNEIWKDITGFEGLYQVSNLGRVKSLPRKNHPNETIRKIATDKKGYSRVNLIKDGKNHTKKVHRLVAEAFIPNPENKPSVDHINCNKSDNRVSNLRWYTYSEQVNDNPITKEKINKLKKPVRCKTTGLEFKSQKEAREYYNITARYLFSKKQKTCGHIYDENGKRIPLEWEYI